MPTCISEMSTVQFDLLCVCFSIVNRRSFDLLPTLLGDDNTPRILVGCQADLRCENGVQSVSSREGLSMMEALLAHGYIECSALNGHNVRTLFDYLGRLSLGKGRDNFVALFTPEEFVIYDNHPIFQEFCRLFGPPLRKRLPGARSVDIMVALKRMFKVAPTELKMQIKQSLLPATFFKKQDILIPSPV
jgi:hypothetical protein